MGTWGAGNFDSDGALDYIGEIASGLTARIEACFADEESSALDEDGEGVLVPSVAILLLLCEHCAAAPPRPDVAGRWKRQYLTIFDDQIDSLEPAPGYKQERRQVIEDTFRRLQARAAAFWQDTDK